MRKKEQHIPVNFSPGATGEGIFIGRLSFNGSPGFAEVGRSHRDQGYSFILQEKGATHIEIDFQQYVVKAPALICIHPDQVHRIIKFEKATISSWIIAAGNLQPEYLGLLNELLPVQPLSLKKESLAIITETASVCIKLCDRKEVQLYDLILKEACNTLVALVISQYLSSARPADKHSRFEVITKVFKSTLERDFKTVKSPMDYAASLNISTPYLNECVKAVTGHPVSYHIQQRVILEAQRLLYHSAKSIKEIAGELGYEDYSYFTRLFVKVTGITPVAFRNKNLD